MSESQGPAGTGIAAVGVPRWGGAPPMFAFCDPDGNRLEVIGDGSQS